MKEIKFVNLTSRSQKPYSGYGDKIMEGKPDMPPNSQPTNPEGSEAKPISAENKRAADMMALGKDQKLPVGVRRALEDIKRQEVIKNALLGDSERVDVAAQLLRRDLTEKEREALLKAHNQGKGEAGKHNGPAGVYNYTNTQLLKKTRILNEAGFSKEDRRILMDAGLVGAPGPTEGEAGVIDKADITNPIILEAIDVINAYRDAELPVEDALKEAVGEIARAKNIDPGEKKLVLQRIAERISEVAESKKAEEKKSEEEARFGKVLSIQKDQIQDPTFKSYVSEINSLIDEIGKGRLDDKKYQALYNKINSLQPPDSYGVVPDGDDEASRAEARIRETRMNAFDDSKQILKSAISQARRILMSSGRGAESEAEREVIEKLVDAIRDEDYDSIDEAIRTSGFNPGDQRGLYGEVIVRAAEAAEKMGDKDHMVEYLLEFGLERIISRADENPSDSYPQFNLYESYNIDNIIQAARKYDENGGKNTQRKREMFSYLTNLQYKRRAMHDLFQGMKDRETYVKLVTQLLRRNGLDFVEHKIAGVSDVQMMYEQILGSMYSLKSKEQGWLNHQDFQDADTEVAKELMKYKGQESESLRKEYRDKDGKPQFRSLREWEIKRAGMVGRSLNTATERRITYGVMGELPKNVDERLRSLEFEFIARTLAPLKLIPDKFFDYATAMKYLELSYEELKMKDGKAYLHKYGYVDKDGKEKGLYGKSQNAMAILDTGIGDLKSNSWRGRLLLLKNKDYLTAIDGHGNKEAIMDYLDRIKVEVESRYKEEIRRMKPDITELELKIQMEGEKYPYKAAVEKEFNERVARVVGDQRLFLGALIKNAGLNGDNKIVVWKNIAKFLPSRVAAFLPHESMDIVKNIYGFTNEEQAIEKWNEFKFKLFRVERARVKRDAIALKTGGDGQTKELEDFYEKEHVDAKEKELIEAIRQLGVTHAKDFSTIAFPFTPFLDDVPETDWNNLEDNDLDRLLINDHSNFAEGWGKVTGLIANSGAKPEDIIKEFSEGFKGVSSPLGIKDAQKKFEPFINAYMRFSRENNWAKVMGTIMKWGRVPRSEAEKYNLQSRIALDEKNQLDVLSALAQNQIISDDPTEADKNGDTQLWRVRKRNKLDILAMIEAQFRVVAMLFGPVFALELFKSILPPDMAKSLG